MKIEAFHLLIGGCHRAYFSTMTKALGWKNKYMDEFPMVRNIGWEIKRETIETGNTSIFAPYNWMDPPMHFRRGDPPGTLIPVGTIMKVKK